MSTGRGGGRGEELARRRREKRAEGKDGISEAGGLIDLLRMREASMQRKEQGATPVASSFPSASQIHSQISCTITTESIEESPRVEYGTRIKAAAA